MKKPVFIKCELPPGFEIDKPLRISTEHSLYALRVIVGIRRKVSEITKTLEK